MTVGYADVAKVVEAAADAAKVVLVYSVGIKSEAVDAFKALGDKLSVLALSPARNSAGADAAGLSPMSPNGAATQFFLLGEQSEDAGLADKLNGAFTIVQASYKSALVKKADVVLPTPLWYRAA